MHNLGYDNSASIGISTEISCTGNEPALTKEQKNVPPEQEPTATEDGNEILCIITLKVKLYFHRSIYLHLLLP